MLIENLEFNTSSSGVDILQYNPNEFTEEEKKPPQIQMDFSTPIQDVVPSAEFNAPEGPMDMPMGGGSYNNPTNHRVTGLSMDSGIAPPSKKSATTNPFGLTDEQLQAAISGVAAVLAFSGPVQNKLSDFIATNSRGDLTMTGMIASALIAAIIFFLLHKIIKQK